MEYCYSKLYQYLTEELEREKSKYVYFRHQLHQCPELSKKEEKTASMLLSILKKNGIKVRSGVGGYGIEALIEGEGSPTVALRADMDGLPIIEETNLDFASRNVGIMHACGHDFHMACVLATGLLLQKVKDQLPGNVKLIFQPSEELGPLGGARPMIEDGVLKNPQVEAIFAGHVFPDVPMGKIGIVKGVAMAASDNFILQVNGKGGHVASPEDAIDPIEIASQIVLKSKNLIRSYDEAILGICMLNAGTKRGIIPQLARMEGTLRTFHPHVHEEIRQKFCQMCRETAREAGGLCVIEWNPNYGVTNNDKDMAELAEKAILSMMGSNALYGNAKGRMTSEDFGAFLKEVPGAFLFLGASNGTIQNLHSPTLTIDDDVLLTGIKMFLSIVLYYFEQKKQR